MFAEVMAVAHVSENIDGRRSEVTRQREGQITQNMKG